MVQYQGLQVPDQEYTWIQSSLKRDLLRFPELDSFDDGEVRRLVIHWDDIFVRWLQRFYRPVGIEVKHEPEDKAYPVHFYSLPKQFERLSGYYVEPPSSLSSFELRSGRVKKLIVTYGREGVVKEYLVRRLSELSKVSKVWPQPLII